MLPVIEYVMIPTTPSTFTVIVPFSPQSEFSDNTETTENPAVLVSVAELLILHCPESCTFIV